MRPFTPLAVGLIAITLSSCSTEPPGRRVGYATGAAGPVRARSSASARPFAETITWVPSPVLPQVSATITLCDAAGKAVRIELKPDVVVLLMATWCSHSAPLRDLIQKHQGESGLAGLRLVYVFEDEWPRARDMLAKEAGVPAEQIEKQLDARRQQQGGGPLLAPDFLKACTAEVFYAHPDHPLPGQGYPRLIAADGRIQPGNAGEWLQDRLGR